MNEHTTNYISANNGKIKNVQKLKQSNYRSGEVLRVPGVWGSWSSRQFAH